MADPEKNTPNKRVDPKQFWVTLGLVIAVCSTVASTSIAIVNADNHREVVALFESKEALRQDMNYRWENTTDRLKRHEDSIINLKTTYERITAQLETIKETLDETRADVKVLRNGH